MMCRSAGNSGERQNMCANLRRLRLQHGYSLDEVAAMTDIPAALLETLETGVVPGAFDIGQLFNLCRLFHVNPADLFRM